MVSKRAGVSTPLQARTVAIFRFEALLTRLKEAGVGFVVFLAIADGMMKDLFHSEARKCLLVKKSGPFAENVAMWKSVGALRRMKPQRQRPSAARHRFGLPLVQ
jgi:hypothetical protein